MAKVVVIGSGAVGTLAAAVAAQRGHQVVLLDVSPAYKDDLIARSPRTRHSGFTEGWRTGAGGTTTLWGGQVWCWDKSEFRLAEPGIDEWPSQIHDLTENYRAVFRLLGLPYPHEKLHLTSKQSESALGDDFSLKSSSWMSRRERNFHRNRALHLHLRTAEFLRNCSEIAVNEESRTVSARQENTSLKREYDFLLIAAGTLGNFSHVKRLRPSNQEVGRGFIDHVSSRAIELEITDHEKFRSAFYDYRLGSVRISKRHVLRRVDHVSSCLPAYAHVETPSAGKEFVRSGKRPRGQIPLTSVAELARSAVIDRPSGKFPLPRDVRAFIRIDVQQPSRDSAFLAESPQGGIRVSWEVGQREAETFNIVQAQISHLLSSSIHGCVPRVLLQPEFVDTYHMMGGTRMGSSSTSVVNPSLRLSKSDSILILGASTFPSGGLANPTITSLALAHRAVSRMDLE